MARPTFPLADAWPQQKAPPPPLLLLRGGALKAPSPPFPPWLGQQMTEASVCLKAQVPTALQHPSCTPRGRMRQWMHVVAHGKGPRPPAPLRTQGPLCMWLRQLAGLDRSRNFGDSFFLIRKVFPEMGSGKKKEK